MTAMRLRPLLLVDVDGVLCPFGPEKPEGYRVAWTPREAGLWISEANAGYLNRLANAFDMAWCTARYDDVTTTIAVLHGGVGEDWPIVPFTDRVVRDGERIMIRRLDDEGENGSWTWKLSGVQAWLEAHGWARRAVAWVDDDLHAPDVAEWATERDAPTYLRPINPVAGLREHDVEDLEAWARRTR